MLKIVAILFSVAVFPVSSIVNRGSRGDSSYYDQRGANGAFFQSRDKELNGPPPPAIDEEKPFFWDETHDGGFEDKDLKHHSGSFSQRVDQESPFIWKDSPDVADKDSRVHVIKEESHSVKTQHYKTEEGDNYDGASNGYGSYQADGWRPIKSSKQGGRSYSSYSKASRKGGAFVSGSCETRLTAPMNSVLRCSSYSGCQATCLRDYQFPSGETQLFFACHEGKWRVRGSTDDEIPQCHPSCLPPCQNGGICTSPNTCQCSQTFFGPYCQYEKKACTDTPPTPNNAKKICNSESCTIQCLANHQFSDGSAIANVFCKEGVWVPGRPDWKTVPDCKPVCSPPCLNGGSCMSNNLCQCPQQYRGSQCQYSVDVCDARKLNFNGNYNCSGTGDYFSCTLTCPLGMSFASNVAIGQVYTCDYSTGSFIPSVVPQCVFGAGVDHNSNYLLSSHTMETINMTKKTETNYGYLDLNKLFVLEKKPPTAGSCSIWGGAHYKTFDGSIVSFKSGCPYTLVSDLKDNKFNVQTQNTETDCVGSGCTRSFNIYINDILYRLLLNDAGMPEVRMSLQNFSVPSQLPDLRVDISGKMVITTLQSLNVKMMWNQKDLVDVEVGEELWNSTGGLCGTMDGHSTNDLTEYHESVVEYAEKWSVQTFGEVCQSKVVDVLECGDAETQQAAHEFCNKIMIDQKFKQCRNTVMVREFYDACRWDFCACKLSAAGATNCACESIEMFVKECAKKGVTDIATWRDATFCPMQCSGGKIYMSCGPATEATCRSQQNYNQLTQNCEEGCFCPEGTLAEDGRCILPKDCPCQLRGKTFKAGATVPSDCNTCTCVNGQWSCTDLLCTARCEAVGDPHYRTFDGRHYDFMGKCSYHLLRTDNYSISAENVACDGSISEAFGYSPSKSPSCTKAVTVLSNDGKTAIKLKQNKLITVNGEDVTTFPLMFNDIYIRAASSIFVQVELPDEINVLWDGFSRVYIHVSPNLKGKTQGLCGTFNGMQKDDFMTPEGDIEQDISSFADKWKAKETCDNISDQEEKADKHPCDVKVQNRELAETYCSNLTSRLFADCHMFVDPMPYYQNCLYDLCSCRSRKMSDCFCPMLAAYAKQCADQGAIVEWRSKVRECGLQCSGGQVYTVCGDSCTRTCQDIAGRNRACRKECVDGCNCLEGRALDSRGDCVPISSCHCLRDGMEYPPGHKDIQRSSKGLKLCKCESGAWSCKLATEEEIAKYPNEALEHKITCSSKKFQDFTHCLPAEPITCKNMHNYHNLQSSSAICRPGCVCKRGFVLDSLTKECVKPAQCPCHHGGKSYADGEEIKESCNKCTCKASKWQCTEHLCPSVCTTWGDSHFKTFDGKFYDFQGACDYVLSKGMISVNESFTLSLEIVPCGTSGVSCPKSAILTVHSGDVHESIQFSKHKPIPSYESLKKITVREAGLFIFADVIDFGIVVQWDKGTRVTVKADLKWKNRLKGLCGNYNDNEADDFQTPAGGIVEVSSTTFGDSWKLHSYCPEAFAVKDTCEVHPNRRSWAIEKCGILKSPTFKPCHSEVPVELYLDRCIFDTCGCDQGGDCECLCTAIAAYAEQCNLEGVPIKWRTQQLCPMQCDEKCSEYKACTQTCPIETCDNLLTHAKLSQLCRQDSCVEGCDRKPCPAGQIYQNATSYECIPVALCKPICKTEDGQEFYEGDIVELDACHTCFCSHHKKVCTGTPCTTEVILSSTSFLNLTTMTVTTTMLPEVNINDQLVCVSGWTDWINKHHPSLKEPNFDFENASAIDIMNQISQPIDFSINKIQKPQCNKNEMTEIQCREVETKKHYKEFGQDVECTIEGGLICSDPNKCNDYEIRVLCNCNDSVYVTPETTTLNNEVELLNCNSTHPLAKHPTNCFKYFQCEETTSGSFTQVERECTSNLWFNPNSLTCDWPHSVLKLRPECEQITEITNNNLGCVDTWSDWLNISNPRNSGGDFELISVMQREHMNICKNNGYIKDIECQYLVETVDRTRSGKYKPLGGMSNYVEYHDVKHSPDVDVTCDKNVGLECVNDKQSSKICQDYRIRILCACEEKKEEQRNEKVHEQAPVTETVYQDCRSDEVYNDCLIKCDQLCHYYEHTLPRYTEYCSLKSRKQCLPGCSSLSNPVNCSNSGQRWRDFSSCVSTNDCTCRSHNGTLVKPGQVLWESNCEACQCLNNHYVCDKSECLKTTIHPTSYSVTHTIAPTTLKQEMTTTTESYSTQSEDISFTTLSETHEPTRTTQNIFILTSTVSPPPFCNKDKYKPLLGGVENVQLSASSNSNFSVPEYGILVDNNEKNWKPIINNQEQYLEINLGQVTPVYSIISAGDEHSGEFVTSYYVLYSDDGQTFSYVMDGAEPQLFRGPLTSLLTMQQEFKAPVEGKYFRINPNSWREGIAMRVQLFGCSNETIEIKTTILPTESTSLPTSTPYVLEPVCSDKMGVESGALKAKQISFSSHLDDNFKVHDIALNSDLGWAPLVDSPHQWVQFDFLEERTITGVETKGGSVLVDGKKIENAWVEAYKIAYSHDGSEWNFIMEDSAQSDNPVKKIFVGNFDANSLHKNFFHLPIHAQYLRVYPFKWHRSILMKVEILGCFVQYPEDLVTTIRPETTREYFTTTTKLEKCSVCAGATLEDETCPCLESSGKYWDGEKCSPRSQCPCFVGHMSYPVGSVYYKTKDCSRCTCTFGGISECSVQECPSCEEGKVAKRSPQCECLCVECDAGMKLCPTSNICIHSTSWCDGFVDCPDDELNCTTVETTTPHSSTTVESKHLRCPPVECPPGFKIKLVISDNEESNDLEELFSKKSESTPPHSSKTKWGSHFNKHGRGFYGGGMQSHWGRGNSYWSNGQYSQYKNVYRSYHTSRYHSHSYHGHHHGKFGSKFFDHHHEPNKNIDNEEERCPEYECVPIKKDKQVCVTPVCTKGYDLVEVESSSKTENNCPKFICKLTPLPDARCNITGRTFNTFDGLEFKYDVCDHVLAQSMADVNWQIRLIRTCSYIGPCKKSLKIKNFNNTIIFNTDMSVVYNGYDYTVEQCRKIGGQSFEFAIKKISDKFIIFKSSLDFSVIWDVHGNVKIVLPHKLVGDVNGLCGLFDDDKENDRQKPDRTFAHSTTEFGDSWGNSESCETRVCPIEIQNKAWEMCMNVKKAPLAICGNVINVDKYLSQCVESICNCLEGQTSTETVKVNTTISSTEVEKCKCDALLDFVTECQESNPGIDISNWRIVNNCPVDCPAPFIYKECYNRVCEMGCSDLMDDNPCPTSEGSCFPGCYCPDGLIKEKETCIKPLECQDCVCDGFGKTRYVTFDRADYTFNSNCTYKLVETVPEFNEGPKFTIVATTGLCDYENSKTESTCIKSLTFIYGVHSAQVGGLSTKDNYHRLYLKTNIGEKTQKFPYRNRWIDVQENNGNGLIIHLVTTHVKVLFFGRDKGFSIHMPSQLYFNNTQGLCGRCNRNETDDFITSDGVVQTENIEMFGRSWRAVGVSSIIGEEKECDVIPQKEIECLPPPPDQDACMKLLNGDIFGQCHAVIDPAPFVASCHESYCHDKGALDICGELHSYARECMSAGICVDWRSQLECPHHCAEGLVYKPCTLGCLETCDNYNLLREKPEMCTDPKIEACVCPVGQVLLNGTCVPEARCQPCDTLGHFAGDRWQPDPCTSCTCHSPTAILCQRTECPAAASAAILCQTGYRARMRQGTETDCCPQFVCAPDNSPPVCNDTAPVQPLCGQGQRLKLEVDSNGCEHYSCECKPASECEDTSSELNKTRNPGLVAVLVESGCCPEVKVVCKKQLCQPPPRCERFFELHEVMSEAADACCPSYACEPPKDKCLYEFEFIEEPNSGVRKRTTKERYMEAKNGGEVWYDGPCHKCECSSTDFKSHCTTKQCSLPTTDSADYVVETMHIAGQCCPVFIRTACKVDDVIYQEGEVWRSPSGDPCKNFTCVKNEDGKITKQDIVETCKKDCRKGWKYVEPTVDSKECCGQCQPFACVIDDEREMTLNSVWHSEDNCTTYTCSAESDQVFISSSQQLCPPLEECPAENIIKDGCCQKCNQTTSFAQSLCAPESLPANETLKLIRHLDAQHGLCQNVEVLDAFTECRGTCDSYTYYNKDTESHDSKCQCCQAVKYDSIHVSLTCEDGSVMEKAVFVPAKCVCMACGA